MNRIDGRNLPFTVGRGTPAKIGRQIARIYAAWAEQPPPAAEVWRTAAKAVGLDEQSPFFNAGYDVARTLDLGEGTGIQHGYHNKTHYVEVLSNAAHLILRNNKADLDDIVLTQVERGKVLFAALTHDLYYEPGGNKDSRGNWVPYRLEAIAFLQAQPYLQKYGVTKEDIDDIRVMIFTTDVTPASQAGSFLRRAHAYFFGGGEKPIVTGVQESVSRVLQEPRLARLAGLLSDADILSSAGLSPEYNGAQGLRLDREFGRASCPRDTINFLECVAGDRFTTRAARFFQPNMEAIKEAVLAAMSASPDLARNLTRRCVDRPNTNH